MKRSSFPYFIAKSLKLDLKDRGGKRKYGGRRRKRNWGEGEGRRKNWREGEGQKKDIDICQANILTAHKKYLVIFSLPWMKLRFLQEGSELIPLLFEFSLLLLPLFFGTGADEGFKAGFTFLRVQQHVARIKHKLGKLFLPGGEG